MAEEPVGLIVIDGSRDERESSELLRKSGAARSLCLLAPGQTPDDAAALGCERYLVRPFHPDTLVALCELLLADARPADPESFSPAVTARPPALFTTRSLYAEAIRLVEEAHERASTGKKPDLKSVRLMAERIHTSLLQSNRLLLLALEPYERFELAPHSVNVALLAGKITMGLGWGAPHTLDAIQAGLLHDVGMARLPYDLLHKEGSLTDEEWDLVREHPNLGAEVISRFGEEYEWLRRAVIQEHERMNGQGYPAGLVGEEIDPLSQVLAVADVFEAFSHPRTYRTLFTTYEALEKVVGLRDEALSGDVVGALVDEISAFPLDSFVLLSSGEIGRVVSTNPTNLMRPVVQTVWDSGWQPVDEPGVIDLSQDTSVTVARPLHETELPIT